MITTPPFDQSGRITPESLTADLVPFFRLALKQQPVYVRLALSPLAWWLVRVAVDLLIGRYGDIVVQTLKTLAPFLSQYLKPEVFQVLSALIGLFSTPQNQLNEAARSAATTPLGQYP